MRTFPLLTPEDIEHFTATEQDALASAPILRAFTSLTPEAIERFATIGQAVLGSVPNLVRYLLAYQDEHGHRFAAPEEALVLVLWTLLTLNRHDDEDHFTATEQRIIGAFPHMVRYGLTSRNAYGDRLMWAFDEAVELVVETFVTLQKKGVWRRISFTNDQHLSNYFRKCLKNAALQHYRQERAGLGDPQEQAHERLKHINRTRQSRGAALLPSLAEGEQFVMPHTFLTAHRPVEPTYVIRPLFPLEFQELKDCVLAQGLVKEWTLIEYKHASGWSNERIAQELGYTVDSVRSLAARYMQRIRNALSRAGFTNPMIRDEQRAWEQQTIAVACWKRRHDTKQDT